MKQLKLFMVLLGAAPPGRFTEQHDVFFGIASELHELLPDILAFWPGAGKKIHVDGWREVNNVNGYSVSIIPREQNTAGNPAEARLFFINLGGYKENELEEFHYKMIVAAAEKGAAIKAAKDTAFYQHTGFRGATSHIDDKYGVDVDDLYEIADILPVTMKEKYSIVLSAGSDQPEDSIQLGYLTIAKLEARAQMDSGS